jgi:transcriptional regulator with XRE-family HTH domain
MIERGQRQPSLKSLTKIADALGVPVAVLMSDSRREIQVDKADVLRREVLTLMQGLNAEDLQKSCSRCLKRRSRKEISLWQERNDVRRRLTENIR